MLKYNKLTWSEGTNQLTWLCSFLLRPVLMHVSEYDRTLAGSEYFMGWMTLACFFCFVNLLHMTIPVNTPPLVS